MRIAIRVRSGSTRPGIGGAHAGALVVRVSARAVDGKATEAALAAVAGAFSVRRSAVRPGPDVADSEGQRLAGLERQRAAAQLSPGRAEQCAIQLGAGEHEAVVIDGDVLEPAGGRGGAYKAEQAPAWLVAVGSVVARRCGVHGDGLKMPAAVQRGDLRGGAHGYPGMSQDAVGKVGGHAGGQVIAAHDQGDGVAASSEIQRRLAGGVRPAGERDRARTAGRGLQLRRRVIDARAFELRLPVEWQGSVAGAGGDDHCSRLDSGVVGQHDSQTLVGGVQPVAWLGLAIRAPNFCACTAARPVSSAPLMPEVNPR
jgi:hypothetical protein